MKIGHLLCVGIRGTIPGEDLLERDLDACLHADIGGVILFDVDVPTWRRLQQAGMDAAEARNRATRNILDADQVRALTSYIKKRLGPHVFIGIDQEGGQVARLSPVRGFPVEPTALEFASLGKPARRQAATRQASQLAALGFDLNFAPCVDLALEAHNPIITELERSFGTDPQLVIECADIVLGAHAAAGVAACLKHFPGHGSSRGDTHQGAVDITATWQRDRELEPFRILGQRSGVAIMVGHMIQRQLGGDRPASLSAAFIDGLLRTELGFEGVVITDAIDMGAVADRFGPGEAAVAAISAGADLVIDGFNLRERTEHPAPVLTAALTRALADGQIPGGAARIQKSLARLRTLRNQIGTTT